MSNGKLQSVKTLSFPADYSAGRVYISDNYVRERFVAEARGQVVVPANRLVKLVLYPHAIAGLDSVLEHLTADDIDHLSFEHCPVTDRELEPIFRLTSIQKLSLQFTKIDGSGAERLREMPNLTTISAWWSRMRDKGLSHIAGISTLETLDVSRTQITDEGVLELIRARALRTLVLRDNRITDAAIAQLASLPALQDLSAAETDLTDECIPSLIRIQSLVSLDISKTKITPQGAAVLGQSLPNCRLNYDSNFAGAQLGQVGCALV